MKIKDKRFLVSSKSYQIFFSAIALVIFGFVMIYSASSYSAFEDMGDSFYYVKRQMLGGFLGLAGLIFLSYTDYKKLLKFRYLGVIISAVLLALVFVPGIGVENYGAKRWIKLLPGFSPQPSEIAKFGFILFASGYLFTAKEKVKTFKGCLPVMAVGGGICLLILLEPNLSITVCMGLLMLTLLFVGGMRVKHFLILMIPLLALVPILIMIEPYRLERLSAFLDPWANPQGEGYQLIQSLYAIGSGGLFGVGLFNSRQKYDFLPFAESDFIFSIICEELGFFGVVILLLVFITLIVGGIKVALACRDRFGLLLCVGIVSIISIQLIINIAVVTGSIPPTGLPLPFISYGTTSVFVFLSSIGVLINVDKMNTLYATSIVCSNNIMEENTWTK